MATDRELAQALATKKQQDSNFDAIGAFHKYYGQKESKSLSIPLDFGKAIPKAQVASVIKDFNPTTRSRINPNYYDPTVGQVVPVNPNHTGFWQTVGEKLTQAYNAASHTVAAGVTMSQANLTNFGGDKLTLKERWNQTQDISAGQAVFSAAAQTAGFIPSLTAPDVMKEHFLAGSKGFDILDPAQREEAFSEQNFGRVGSWTADFIARFTIDPTIIGGKLIKGYRLAGVTLKAGEEAGKLFAAKAAGEKLTKRQSRVAGSIDDFLHKTDDMTTNDLGKIKSIRDSSNPAVLSDLFNSANKIVDKQARHQVKLDIIDMAMGDATAFERLAKSEQLLAAKVGALQMEVDGAKFLGRGVDDAGQPVFDYMSTGPMLEKQMELLVDHKSQLESIHKNLIAGNTLSTNIVPYIDNISEMRQYMSNSQSFIDLRSGGLAGSLARFHTGFFYKRPKNWIDFTDNTSIQTIDNMLNQIVGTSTGRLAKYDAAIATQQGIIDNPLTDAVAKKIAKDSHAALKSDLGKAHFTVERKNELYSQYAAAVGPEARSLAYRKIEEEVFSVIAKQFGYSNAQVKVAFNTFKGARDKAYNLIKERSFSGGIDPTTGEKIGSKITPIVDEAGVNHVFAGILNETQILQQLPTLDVNTMYRVLRRANVAENLGDGTIRQNAYKAFLKGKSATTDLADSLDTAIKFQVLARVGYPIRNVTEGSMRIMAVMGPMVLLHGLKEGVASTWHNVGVKLGVDKAFDLAQRHGLETEAMTLEATIHSADNPAMVKERIAEIEKLLAGKLDPRKEYGLGTITVLGYTYADAKGATPDAARYINQHFISNASKVHDEILTKSNSSMSKAMQTGDWVDIEGSHPDWATNYLRVVNQQMRGSELTTRILAGASFDDVVTFLKTDAEGRRLTRIIGGARGGSSEEEIARINFLNVDHMFPADQAALKAVAAKGPITAKDVTKYFGQDSSKFPTVNGAQTSIVNGTNSFSKITTGLLDKFYKYAGQIPEDKLTKTPLFVNLYRDRMAASVAKAIQTLPGDTISPQYMKQMEYEARQFARNAMRKELYDLSERTDSAHAVKYLFPFFGAFSDVAEKWGRIIIDDPSVFAKLSTVYQSPDRNGLTEERDGVTYINLPSSWAKAMSLGYSDQLAIPKASLNLIFQGGAWWNPGAGWFVQTAASAIVSKWPVREQDAWVNEILPYGVQNKSVRDLFLQSPSARKALALLDAGDPQRANLTVRILAEEMTKFNTGVRTTVPTKDEINKRAKATLTLQVVSRLILPFASNVKSPYQFYIDEYQAMRNASPNTANEDFYDKYGDSYFAMTQSLSKNNTGINATVDAYEASKKYKDLIAEAPEYGWFIVGEANAGAFSSAVYGNQQSQKVAPGSNINFREKQDPYEAYNSNQANLGWIEFKRGTAWLENQRIMAGFSSLNSKGAEYLANKKRQFISQLSNENPAWGKSYGQIDSTKITSFLKYATKVVADPRLKMRSDILSLKDYLSGREWMRMQLSTRSSQNLDNPTNADLRLRWDEFTGALLNKDVTFGDIYNRILEKDDLSGGIN